MLVSNTYGKIDSRKNIVYSVDKGKSVGENLFEIQQWPLEPSANQHSQFVPLGWIGCAGWLVTQKTIVEIQKFLLYFCLYH